MTLHTENTSLCKHCKRPETTCNGECERLMQAAAAVIADVLDRIEAQDKHAANTQDNKENSDGTSKL
jgi:hypothetical protein